jgi:hypothetical protein
LFGEPIYKRQENNDHIFVTPSTGEADSTTIPQPFHNFQQPFNKKKGALTDTPSVFSGL